MKIDCYLSEQCGSYHELTERISAALRELGRTAEVEFHTICYEDAVSLGITGSPTIRINGKDMDDPGGSPGLP
jgi:hypothetical protein